MASCAPVLDDLRAAFEGATEMANTALAALENTDDLYVFRQFYGPSDCRDTIYGILESIVENLEAKGQVPEIRCALGEEQVCEDENGDCWSSAANAHRNSGVIILYQLFFDEMLFPTDIYDRSQAAYVIHELSHIIEVVGSDMTWDHATGLEEIAALEEWKNDENAYTLEVYASAAYLHEQGVDISNPYPRGNRAISGPNAGSNPRNRAASHATTESDSETKIDDLKEELDKLNRQQVKQRRAVKDLEDELDEIDYELSRTRSRRKAEQLQRDRSDAIRDLRDAKSLLNETIDDYNEKEEELERLEA